MDSDVYDSTLKIIFHWLIVFVAAIYGVYFLYFHVYVNYKISKTQEDIQLINRNVQEMYKGLYKNLNTFAAYQNHLIPSSVKGTRNENQVVLQHRFGGNLIIMEGLNSGSERSLFYGLINDPQKYNELSSGVTAYIIMLTGLDKKICRQFAQIDWLRVVPNFIGMEVSNIPANNAYQGFNKLRAGFISDDKENDRFYAHTKDSGIISDVALSADEAKSACACRANGCSIALKLR